MLSLVWGSEAQQLCRTATVSFMVVPLIYASITSNDINTSISIVASNAGVDKHALISFRLVKSRRFSETLPCAAAMVTAPGLKRIDERMQRFVRQVLEPL